MMDSNELKSSEARPVFSEPKWITKFAAIPTWIVSILLAFPTLPATFIFSTDNKFLRGILIILCVVSFCFGAVLAWFKDKRDKDTRALYDKRVDQEKDAYAAIIDEMNLVVFSLIDALSDSGKRRLTFNLSLLRKNILSVVRHRLGPQNGVQANMFTVDSETPPYLSVHKWGVDGGNWQLSKRKFREGDKTYDLALKKQSRHIKNTTEELEDDEIPNRGYKTFATYPISNNDELFGILTIDAPEPGEITDLDVQLLGFFAGILAVTFVEDVDAKSIPLS